MGRTYISTFLTGFKDIITENLSKKIDIFSIDLVLDGLVMYKSSTEIDSIKKINFINNSFVLLKFFDNTENISVDNIIKQIISDKNIDYNIPEIKNRNKTFRVIVSVENQLISIDKKLLSDLELKISKDTKLQSNRSKPDIEFWISLRSEGYAFFGIRFTKNPNQEKYLEKGELRPELASILCLLSDPNPLDVFLDPFCGSGSIPIQRTFLSKFKTIFSYDTNSDLVDAFKLKIKRIQKRRGIKNFFVHNMDALNMKFLSDSQIDKIVTDPPWGLYDNIENLDIFYSKMLIEFHRVVRDKGTIVLLVANRDIFTNVLEKHKSFFDIDKKYTTLVSGQKAIVYKLINNKRNK